MYFSAILSQKSSSKTFAGLSVFGIDSLSVILRDGYELAGQRTDFDVAYKRTDFDVAYKRTDFDVAYKRTDSDVADHRTDCDVDRLL